MKEEDEIEIDRNTRVLFDTNVVGEVLTLNPADFADAPGLAVLQVSMSE